MQYVRALVYDQDGNFQGYGVLKAGLGKLQSVNLYSEVELSELDAHLARLNQDVALKAHWPKVDEPEVRALLNDSNWEPYETMLADVVDEDNSYYVWQKDDYGTDTENLDEDASVIATKTARVPVRQSDVQARIHFAQQTVASQRAGV
jgi:hypothetical protein